MRIDQEIKLDYKDVLFRPKRSTLTSRNDVCLEREFSFPHSKHTWSGIPIVAANMDTVGTFEVARALSEYKMLTCIQKHYSRSFWKESINDASFAVFNNLCERVAISCGIKYKEGESSDLDYLSNIAFDFPLIKFICVDAANGYTKRFCDFVKRVREKFPEAIIIAGNVVTGEMTEEIILSGADVCKIGIGGGSCCTTRIQTGVGYGQFSAVMECADAAHGLNGHIMADGGCVCAGDVAKAFGVGADFVMLGGMFAGHDESAGEIIEEDGQKYKAFYGMSSETAMNKYYGGVAEYRSSEGKTVKVKYRGPIKGTIESILGGVRSACTYIGARKIKDMPKCATFIRVTQQSNEVFGKNI